MYCWSDKGQTEPLAALVAVAAVGLGLSLYAGALDGALAGSGDRQLAEPTLDRVERTVAPAGVVRPNALESARSLAPDGYRLNLTLVAGGHHWRVGPSPGHDVRDRASRPVSVRVAPADVRPGTLRVVVVLK